MHPDYLDYQVKETLSASAKWHDVKFLVRKVTNCDLRHFYVEPFMWAGDYGFLVSFRQAFHVDEMLQRVNKTIKVAENVIWIGVK